MDIKLPKLGEGSESGTVVNILVKEGDTVSSGQTILELENEKAVAPVPATAGGVVAQVRVKVGDKISVGQVLITLGSSAAPAPATPPPASKPATEQKRALPAQPAALAPASAPVVATPAPESADSFEMEPLPAGEAPAAAPSIRRMARELGIDLRRVRGTDRGGRIVLSDLRAYIESLQRIAFTPRPAAPVAAPSAPVAPAAKPTESIDFAKWGPVTRKPLTALRQTIARRMQASWHAVPRVTQFDEADITALNDLRKRFAPAYEEKGAKLTLTPLILKAVAATLKKHPLFNASLDEAVNEIVFKDYIHLGLAVDTEQGLLVPVIRDVDKKNLLQLSQDVAELAEKARERKVSMEDMKGGTFTISNQGGIGGAHFTPIINLPEVAILGLGRSALKPVVREDKIVPRLMMPLTVAYDHRLIDGGSAARFTVDLVMALEKFAEAELKLS
jgi:pyruvate dehydrogenase E2 component (dihydrolipoamide acetyltransferase)